ncbi:hypothetical protein MKEN_00241400 [Mycena kentingensis (nom. inval.)]|nr:hypothetical protein MKEN_00241400 [Mycena kentingensis (nom. inval.)]
MPTTRKVKVAPQLREELQDYASLLRALDTTDSFAVARSIADAPPPTKRRKLNPDAVVEPAAEPAAEPVPKHRKRDTWTRWPLLVGDTKVPEFGLDDEIAVLVRQSLPDDIAGDEDEDDSDNAYLAPICASATSFLSSILALLAHHTPARPQSMQDRLNPIGWQTVLDVAAACGDVDSAVVSNVKSRLEAIYGASDSPAIDRLNTRTFAPSRLKLRDRLQRADDELFSFVGPPPEEEDEDEAPSEDEATMPPPSRTRSMSTGSISSLRLQPPSAQSASDSSEDEQDDSDSDSDGAGIVKHEEAEAESPSKLPRQPSTDDPSSPAPSLPLDPYRHVNDDSDDEDYIPEPGRVRLRSRSKSRSRMKPKLKTSKEAWRVMPPRRKGHVWKLKPRPEEDEDEDEDEDEEGDEEEDDE